MKDYNDKNLKELLQHINSNIEPLTKEINSKLSLLQNAIKDTRDLQFKEISLEEIKKY